VVIADNEDGHNSRSTPCAGGSALTPTTSQTSDATVEGPREATHDHIGDGTGSALPEPLPIATTPTICEIAATLSIRTDERCFRALVEQIPAVVYLASPDAVGSTIYVSPQREVLLGYPVEQWVNDPDFWLKVIHGEDRERIRALLARANETGEPLSLEYRYLTADGRVVWVRDEAVLVRDARGEPRYWQGVNLDITARKQAEEEARQSAAFMHSVIDALSAHIAVLDDTGTIVAVNAAWRQFAVENQLAIPHHGLGTNYLDVCTAAATHDGTVRQFLAGIDAVFAGIRDQYTMEYPCHSPTEERWFVAHVTRFPGDGPARVVVAHENITERRQTAAALARQNAYLIALHDISLDLLNRPNVRDVLHTIVKRAAMLLDTPHGYIELPTADGTRLAFVVGSGIFDATGDTRIQRGEGLSGTVWERGEPVVIDDYQQWSGAIGAPHVQTVRAAVAVPLRVGETVTGVFGLAYTEPGRRFDPNAVTLLERFAQLASLTLDNAQLYEQTQRELRERQEVEGTLRHSATHDPLTDLANRSYLMGALERAIRERERQGTPFAVFFLDLDRFKQVNDSLGHLDGDALLISSADRLRTCLPPEAVLARLGGDEFAVLMEGITGAADAGQLAERMQNALHWPFKLRGHEIYVTTSIGIALGNRDQRRPEELLRDADLAMYRAKEGGGAQYAIFDAAMHAHAIGRLTLENELRRAIERDELEIHYQPIVSLATRTITGFEALARWHHPQRGRVSPAAFIPIAEETGLIAAIDRHVLHEACRQMRAWHCTETRTPPLTLSVNVSGKHLTRPDFVAHILHVLGETGLDARTLHLEITESVLIEHTETAAHSLRQLCTAGIHISLDDFGVGYSSLNYLRRFPFDTLKIDRSFIEEGIDAVNAAIIAGTVAIAHQLGMRVIAEGIETATQGDRLHAFGCDGGQGYLFSAPVSALHATRLMRGQRVLGEWVQDVR